MSNTIPPCTTPFSASRGRFFLTIVFAITFISMLAACAPLGLAPAKTFDDKVAYVYATIHEFTVHSARRYEAGTLSKEKAADASKKIQTWLAELTLITALHNTADETGNKQTQALERLAALSLILRQIENKTGGKP